MKFQRELAVICGLALMVGGGYWQGRDSGRWHPVQTPSVDFASLSPDWEGWTATDVELPKNVREVGGIDGYLARNYQNLESGEVITVLILTGPGGPISVHPPDVCCAGRGYKRESKKVERLTLTDDEPDSAPASEHEFETAVFRGPESTAGHRMQLFWAWSSDGVWQAPTNPRFTFARQPRLYKMYVSRTLQPGQDRNDDDACLDLMRHLTAEFERLFPGSSGDPQAVVGRAVIQFCLPPGLSLTRTAQHRPMFSKSGVRAI